ncbi:MAG: histone deacetylase [Cyanobacteria bacterium RU_5_0]|nr:histone deacetylase [Cyanobacteria bacterium RU_5_0]
MLPIIYSDKFLDHDTGFYHPERPSRLTAITNALKAAPWANQLEWYLPTPVDAEDPRLIDSLYAIHPSRYVQAVQRLSQMGGGQIDPDTVVSDRSYEVALLAVNAWLDGVDRVLATGNPAFVLARPPGHHALPDRGMGFCIFANAAIAAHHALQQPGIRRVAILDWDVHHGNGTQAIVETNPNIAYCSLHEFPQYPGTGAAYERGKFDNVLNFPMSRGSTLTDYKPLFEQHIIPFFQTLQPDLLIVSAGYDANKADPLADLALKPQDYGIFTDYCLQVTQQILFGLEGGYDLDALAESVAATIERCLV